MEYIAAILAGYFMGAIPFALIIGKVFYKKDIRNYGSGNLGGGNAGRVLGKKAGLAVMAFDILKVAFAVFIASRIGEGTDIAAAAGLAAAAGHCFPVFAKFKGGKAVATMYGFLFGMGIFQNYGLIIFILPLLVFLFVLYLWKIIALASICSAVFITVFVYLTTGEAVFSVTLLVFTILIIIRHRKNIERMIKHEENKISWM